MESTSSEESHTNFSVDLPFTAEEVKDGYGDLKNSALGLDGVSKSIISPILFVTASALAAFFSALLCFFSQFP